MFPFHLMARLEPRNGGCWPGTLMPGLATEGAEKARERKGPFKCGARAVVSSTDYGKRGIRVP